MSTVLGIDIGGSGIKGCPVNLDDGSFASERLKIRTPHPSTPSNVIEVTAQIVDAFSRDTANEPIGVTVPAPVVHGVTPFMANLDQSWVDVDAKQLFEDRLGRQVVLFNDADAAGMAEVQFGAARGKRGIIIVTTLGTGIGTAIINEGHLLPNTELGHIEIDGKDAETQTSAAVKSALGLTYAQWIPRLQRYYSTLEKYFWPDLFVVGGGVSRDHEKFLPHLKLRAPIVPATLRNRAGIIGAAWLVKNQPGF